ncbi:MAG: D-alanyl-D-alanine carboxypeptidase/D-alanyl-D-alanine-endopeptidase, partial [Actinomycetota bacterium]
MTRARRGSALLTVALCLSVVGPLTTGAGARPAADERPAAAGRRAAPRWIQRIDAAIGNRPFSVAIGNDGDVWYRNLHAVRRPPASNEKLLLSMALFARFGAGHRIRTRAMSAVHLDDGVLRGDLWLIGRGNPEVAEDDLDELAEAVEAAGVTRITGSVMASTGPYARDWWAPGWRDYFPTYYIPIPTALTFRGNEDHAGRNIGDPERRAARHLTKRLEAHGVQVRGQPDMGHAPTGLTALAQIRSDPLSRIVRRMNVKSRNLWAEVLGKHLAAARFGAGTIANAGRAICAYTAAHGMTGTCHDASGLSYRNRANAIGIVRLLWNAETEPWGTTLRSTLPHGGQGTLDDRFADVEIRAKTGTLIDVSALSGWVWLEETAEWAEFSILSSGFDDS